MRIAHVSKIFPEVRGYLIKEFPREPRRFRACKITAYHEAGHILTAINHGLRFVVCELNENCRGAKIQVRPPINNPKLHAQYLLSGLACQYLNTGKLTYEDYCKDFALLATIRGIMASDVLQSLMLACKEIIDGELLINSLVSDLLKKRKLLPADIEKYRP